MPHLALLVKSDGNTEELLLRLREQIADVVHIAGAKIIYSRISHRPLRIMDGHEEETKNGGKP